MTAIPKWARLGALAALCVAGAAQAAEMTIFKQPNFNGDAVTLRDDATSLAGKGFQDQASSIVVKSGRWQVCTQPDFQGECVTLERGQYAALDPKLNHRIESVREVTRYADARGYDGDRGYNDRAYRGDRYAANRYRGPAVELFDGPDFSGRAVRIHGDTESLYRRGFDDAASSMVIHEGRWQVCSNEGYEGYCRTFEPGTYADLRRFDNHVGSLKRIG